MMVEILYQVMLDWEMLSLQYLDRKDLKDSTKELRLMSGDQEAHGVFISYCKQILIVIYKKYISIYIKTYCFYCLVIIQLKLGFKATTLKLALAQHYT